MNPKTRATIGRTLSAILIVGSAMLSRLSWAYDREHQVKTGFIYSIAKFCSWDQNKKTSNSFIVGVYRTKAFDVDIDALNGSLIHGKPVTVVQLSSESDVSGCQIVIVGDIGAEATKHLANQCKNSGTLLVGESEGFAKDGGAVGLIVRDGLVRFQVNLQTAQLDRVTLSSKLLILAEQVYR